MLEDNTFSEKKLIEKFDFVAKRNSEAIALRWADQSLSYVKLQKMAQQCAQYIDRNIDKKIEGILIYLPRNEKLVAVLLACQYLGVPYIPIDIRTPPERVAKILAAASYILIFDSQFCLNVSDSDIDIKTFDFYENLKLDFNCYHSPFAYRIYTSGSTGEPKSVSVFHTGCNNLLNYFSKLLKVKKNISWLSAASISFDIFYLEYALPLAYGGTLIIASDETIKSAQKVAQGLVSWQPDIFQTTPSLIKCLLSYLPEAWCFKQLLIGGELLNSSLSKKLFHRSKWLCQVYGPTETTVWSTAHIIKQEDDSRIGKPIDHTQIKILDDRLNEVITGQLGKIFIGGKGVAQGYFKNPDLTQKKFINLNNDPLGQTFYDTDDIGFIDHEGILNYVCREGEFCKINGFRVEFKEVICALKKVSEIEEAEIISYEDTNELTVMVAWIKISDQKRLINFNAIRQALKRELMNYMVPHYFFSIKEWPYSINGKVDRKALIQKAKKMIKLDIQSNQSIQLDNKNPKSILLKQLAKYIDINQMTIDDNFFYYGLSSMQAISLHLDIVKIYPKIELHDLFNSPTIQSLVDIGETNLN